MNQNLTSKFSSSIDAVAKEDRCPVEDLSVRLAEDRIKSFPTTRFYGSKKRLLPWIYENIRGLPFRSVLDGFGGTASVSLLFKAMGKEVTFNDALLSNSISAKALLANDVPFKGEDEVHAFFNGVTPRKGFIAETFAEKFYLDDENTWLDGAIPEISNQPEGKRAALFYCLSQACMQKRPFNLFHRANLNLRTTRSVNQSFGNQTTWDTHFATLATRAYRELDAAIWRTPIDHTILTPSDVSAIPAEYELVYLDPPYVSNSNGGDNYLRRYHFLEGLCQYEEWPHLIDHSYNNLQLIMKRHISDWQSKKHFKDKLFSLIEKHRHSIVVLSYVANAYPSQKELVTFFQRTFGTSRIVQKELSHALSQGVKNELLIIGIPS